MAQHNTLFSQTLSSDPQTCFSKTGNRAQNRTRFPQIQLQRTARRHVLHPACRKAFPARQKPENLYNLSLPSLAA